MTVAVGLSARLIVRVLRLFEFEYCDRLLWHKASNTVAMSVNCSDVFAWGFADAEAITPGSIVVLEDSFAEMRKATGEQYPLRAPELYCARMRNKLPQEPFMADLSPVEAALFMDAAHKTSGPFYVKQ